jgi:hypothetical protein
MGGNVMGKWRRWIGMVVLISVVLVPGVALASSYSITYNFDSNLYGSQRSFSGQNIAVYLNSTYNGPPSNNFTVKLYRDYWYGSDYIGQGTAPSQGTTTIKWSNVGSGTYNLEMHHTPFGYYVNGSGSFYNY